jgi:hypothetical protein
MDTNKKKPKTISELKKEIRKYLANYIYSEGCSCCENVGEHEEWKRNLAELLGVKKYSDGSGYNFDKYKTI